MPADSDAADLEFDIGDLDDIDEAETKLDLAAAYVDMGDPDGARSILNEVLDEGSEEQRKRANDLLASLG
jgi:pilus assembly protein FimV